jgi:hypothetical protein
LVALSGDTTVTTTFSESFDLVISFAFESFCDLTSVIGCLVDSSYCGKTLALIGMKAMLLNSFKEFTFDTS